MQLKQSADSSQQYKGTIAGLKKIMHEEGLTGLYKGNYHTLISVEDQGVAPKLTQSVINAAFLFMFKEFFFNTSKALLYSARVHPTPKVLDATKLNR
jgi:Mitochondrial carrier protein